MAYIPTPSFLHLPYRYSLFHPHHKIPYYIPEDVTILHKTGEADGITHDIGIVYSKNPFIIGFASNETNIQEFEDIIRKISRFIYEESEK